MTSITSAMSGLSMMDTRIDRAASAGKISTNDQTALGSAMTAINTSLSSSAASATAGDTDMKSRIDGLIQDQVSSGTLTSDQATELQGLFAKGGAHARHGGGKGEIASLVGTSDTGTTSDNGYTIDDLSPPDAADGSQGTPPSPPSDASGAAGSDTSDATTGTSSVSGSGHSDEQKKIDALTSFLQNLRASVAGNSYAGFATDAPSANAGMLINASA